MGFPRYAGKHAEAALITPERFREYLAARGRAIPAPRDAILTFQAPVLQHVDQTYEVERREGSTLRQLAPDLGVLGGFAIGAPMTAIVVEEMVARGTERFVIVGTAGSLQRDIGIGDVVVATSAIRDEGVSHHYLHGDEPVAPTASLTAAIATELGRTGGAREGATWTIDAPYRETIAEVRHYQADGVLTVEMEAAALFAVAAVRGVQAAAVFSISDSLAAFEWDPQFDSPATLAGQVRALEAVIAALGHAPSRRAADPAMPGPTSSTS